MPRACLLAGTALLLLAAAARVAEARVQLNSLFTDGVVLQTRVAYGQRPLVYGLADPSETVVVNVTQNGATTSYSVNAAAGGPGAANASWYVTLNPCSDTFHPISLSIAGSSDGFAHVTVISGAMCGEVIVCSGQSNQVFSLIGAFGGAAIAAVPHPNLRLFPVAIGGAAEETFDFPPADGGVCWWSRTPSPNTTKSPYACNAWQMAVPNVQDYFSAVCLLTALELAARLPANTTIGLIFTAYGGTAVDLWMPPESYAECPATTQAVSPSSEVALSAAPSSLWNAMVAPAQRFAIRSVLWYQGENDANDPAGLYACRFPRMIEGWRRRFRIGDYGFVYAQIANVMPNATPSYNWNQIRTEQAAALPRPGGATDTTGMAVTYDLGDPTSPYTSIHPRNKTEVARRLALQVLHVTYALQYPSAGTWLNYRGPEAEGASPIAAAAGTAIRVTFSTLDGLGLYVADTANCWECCAGSHDTFQLAVDVTGPWVNTTLAPVQSGADAVVVTPVTPSGKPYLFIRYAANTYPQCAIYAVGSAMPAPPVLLAIVGEGEVAEAVPAVAAADAAAAAAAARAALLEQRARLLPVARPGPATWKEWKGRPMPDLVALAESASPFPATPPLGLNAWNAYHTNVDETLLLAVGAYFVNSSLAALGWDHVNIDDGWQVDRLANGSIVPDPVRFPSGMAAFAASLHALGLRAGLYTSRSALTCQDRPGSYGFEAIDAATYCDWGFDYVKVRAATAKRGTARRSAALRGEARHCAAKRGTARHSSAQRGTAALTPLSMPSPPTPLPHLLPISLCRSTRAAAEAPPSPTPAGASSAPFSQSARSRAGGRSSKASSIARTTLAAPGSGTLRTSGGRRRTSRRRGRASSRTWTATT
jgi:hypothetical protein